jgi:hypothetical protein
MHILSDIARLRKCVLALQHAAETPFYRRIQAYRETPGAVPDPIASDQLLQDFGFPRFPRHQVIPPDWKGL